MKAELQNKLIEKYSQFFNRELNILNSDSTLSEFVEIVNQKTIVQPIQFGIECNDGWYFILDNLMKEIAFHIQNETDYQKEQPKSKFLNKISRKLIYGYSWYNSRLSNKFGNWIFKLLPKNENFVLPFYITQIKEKYGSLCFYYNGGDEYIEALVNFAEHLSNNICEICGTTQNIGKTKSWIVTICKSCYDNTERVQHLHWEPKINL